jgi:phage terminase large subunit
MSQKNKICNLNPQKVFQKAYYLKAKDILAKRTFFRQEYSYFVDYGGRGGGKTKDKIKSVLYEASIRPCRVLCCREFQGSIKESIKEEIETVIKDEGLENFFTSLIDEIRGINGSKFIFKGLKNNINNLKSIANVDIVLVEEAENITKNSWEKFLPSIRPLSGRKIVVVIFNPANELDDTYQRFIVNTPPETLLTHVNYWDNKYFPKHLDVLREHDERVLPADQYKHIWEGVPLGSGDNVIIKLQWIKACRFASKHANFKRLTGQRVVGYDPAGQGKDFHAVCIKEGNSIISLHEWVRSDDLKQATIKALELADDVDIFRYDSCGGFGDGVSVFVEEHKQSFTDVIPFDAGSPVVNADDVVMGDKLTNKDVYTNAKAQAHGVTASLMYNTFRAIENGDDVPAHDMISLDIDDDDLFNKVARELSSPIWVKSQTTSKKQVESKDAMKKRTGQPSPNLADSLHMTNAPYEEVIDIYEAIRRKRAGGLK